MTSYLQIKDKILTAGSQDQNQAWAPSLQAKTKNLLLGSSDQEGPGAVESRAVVPVLDYSVKYINFLGPNCVKCQSWSIV